MNKYLLSFFLLSLILGVVCYIVLDNIYYAIVVFSISLIYLLIIDIKRLNNHDTKINRFHECYNFINSFIISLSIKGSISQSFISASEGMTLTFKKEMEAISNMNEEDKINYLKKYFPFHCYHVFVDIVNLYMEEGGDILMMSNNVLSSIREQEEFIAFCSSINKRKIVDFVVLWGFCIVILIVVRYSLLEFYSLISSNMIYQIGVVVILLFVTISTDILLKKTTDITLRGWQK